MTYHAYVDWLPGSLLTRNTVTRTHITLRTPPALVRQAGEFYETWHAVHVAPSKPTMMRRSY